MATKDRCTSPPVVMIECLAFRRTMVAVRREVVGQGPEEQILGCTDNPLNPTDKSKNFHRVPCRDLAARKQLISSSYASILARVCPMSGLAGSRRLDLSAVDDQLSAGDIGSTG